VARVSILLVAVAFLITAALTAGMAGHVSPSQNLEIRNWYDLDAIRDNLSGNHTLMNDLDSTTPGYEELASPSANEGKGWLPIGAFSNQWGFSGTFDGRGYEIRDLFINRPDESNVGLFETVDERGRIEDIGVVNATVTGGDVVGAMVGMLAGYNGGWSKGGSVSNLYSSGTITGSTMVGGLVGYSYGTVSNSYSTSNVTGNAGIGGLVGYNDGTVSNSYSTGSVTGSNDRVGGLAGWNRGTVSNCYSTGSVSGNDSVGGLVGWNYVGGNYMGAVRNSYSTGSVTGYSNVGGLVGYNHDGTVSNSFWDTGTSGEATSAGGTGKTTAKMKNTVTFSGASWDIVAVASPVMRNPSYIWNIIDDETYPFLSWQA
jgi:hypothetical protein